MKKYTQKLIFLLLLLWIPITFGCNPAAQKRFQNITSKTLKKMNIIGKQTGEVATDAAKVVEKQSVVIAKNVTRFTLARYKEFRKLVRAKWGKRAKQATPKELVKYSDNYETMVAVNFLRGKIKVATLSDNYKPSLEKALVRVLTTPDDPRAVDLYSSDESDIQGTPYLYGEIRDHNGNFIKTVSQAKAYSQNIIQKGLIKEEKISVKGEQKVSYAIQLNMEKDHLATRASKYKPIILKYSQQYSLDPILVYSIINTESSFNPFAISRVSAIGLMQIVPNSAGIDANMFINNERSAPSKDFLFDPQNNIQFGSAYLHILTNRYLKGVTNPLSREYCAIAAYNTGTGNVFKAFSKKGSKKEALAQINSMSPKKVYSELKINLPHDETRQYIRKVVDGKRKFTNVVSASGNMRFFL